MTLIMKAIRRVKALKIAKNIFEDQLNAIKLKLGVFVFNIGSTHEAFSVRESLAYINSVYDEYLLYADIEKDGLAGKRILEIGPGDNLGVALKFIASGAAQVVCIDRIYSERNERQQCDIYSALRGTLDPDAREFFDLAVTLDCGKVRFNSERIKNISGVDIAGANKILEGEFDIIVSRAVLEHIYDIDGAFCVMDKHLKKGGRQLHKVDLRDHEMFTRDGFNPLTFLTIPAFVWNLMTRHSGKPNRKTAEYFKEKLEALGYDYDIWVTHLVTRENEIKPHKKEIISGMDYDSRDLEIVKSIRPRLSMEFSRFSDESLLVGGIFITAKKV